MQNATSSTRWRDEPLIPQEYEVASLVPLARKARRQTVEFDWLFSPEDLRRLQRAVYEWGRPAVGRYKLFDAKMLAAMNNALGETDSNLRLKEPKSGRNLDCRVSCVRAGDAFRLQGHGPFDSVFGYGSAAFRQQWSSRLGPIASETLATAVGMLGWDMARLQEESFRPVVNVLYGFPVAYKVTNAKRPEGPALEVAVRFKGPFSATGRGDCPCLFSEEIAARNGVYLWTINVRGLEQVWYVGQTGRGFGQRMGEHIRCYLSGEYRAYDPEALRRGDHQPAKGVPIEREWPQLLPEFLVSLPFLAPSITALIESLRFHVAPLDGDEHLYNRVEGAIGRQYKNHQDRELQNFLMPGLKVPSAIPYDRAIRLQLSSDVPIAGLPAEILE